MRRAVAGVALGALAASLFLAAGVAPAEGARAGVVNAGVVNATVVNAGVVNAGVVKSDYIRDGEYWLDQYGIRNAWSTTKGKGITIAVIDTGVDGSVPDLAGAVGGGTDFSGSGAPNGEKPVGEADERNHGTMVASLAAGRGGPGGSGMLGVAPQAKILPISIGFGNAAKNSDEQIADAVDYAVAHGANVINMSLTRNTLAWPESWDRAFLNAMHHNVVIVAAAGNRGSGTEEVGAPATMPGVLTVAGVDRNEKASVDASAQGITIGVSAPSEQLLGAVPGGGYVQWAGTSGSTPIVSGVVALVMASHPHLSAANVINRVVKTASPAGAKGVDPIYGYGLVDAASAVRATVPEVTANPMGDLAAWIHLNRRAVATAPPTTPPTSAATPGATPVPHARADAAPQNPLGTLYPTPTQLRDVGLPLAVLLAFAIALVAMIATAVRHYRRLRERE